MLTCQFVHMSVFLGTVCEVVRRSCCGKDNGPTLGVCLLPPIFSPQQAFIRNSSSFKLSTVKSLYQIKVHNVNETTSLVVHTDSLCRSMNNVETEQKYQFAAAVLLNKV